MDLKTLEAIPPWEWPQEAGSIILDVLRNDQAEPSDRLLAAELAGDSGDVSDELAEALLSILQNSNEPEALRSLAVISLGPALEYAYMDGFDDPDEVLITEAMFRNIQETLHRLYRDARVPRKVRRRILEASVRAPEDWHKEAVRAAYRSNEEDWKLTAVFCMQYIDGFDEQIYESIGSKNPDILYEAICAAGNWEIDAAWPHIEALIRSDQTEKELLLAAIEAAVMIRPEAAAEILQPLTDSDDEDIVDAVYEALAMAGELWDDEDDDDDNRTLH
ncbi:MAG: hypothetical protein P1P89_03645 [Desulfobacterales bacterium]|nr:hypothetical protein [Desulfobacterales bacterium]